VNSLVVFCIILSQVPFSRTVYLTHVSVDPVGGRAEGRGGGGFFFFYNDVAWGQKVVFPLAPGAKCFTYFWASLKNQG